MIIGTLTAGSEISFMQIGPLHNGHCHCLQHIWKPINLLVVVTVTSWW